MNAVHRLTFRNCPLKKGGAHQRGVPMEERMLKIFAYGHLEREDLQRSRSPSRNSPSGSWRRRSRLRHDDPILRRARPRRGDRDDPASAGGSTPRRSVRGWAARAGAPGKTRRGTRTTAPDDGLRTDSPKRRPKLAPQRLGTEPAPAMLLPSGRTPRRAALGGAGYDDPTGRARATPGPATRCSNETPRAAAVAGDRRDGGAGRTRSAEGDTSDRFPDQ